MTRAHHERGYTAILTALALLFLLGAAALAVDSSMFFQQARAEQRVADLACLAGVQELPEDPASAIEKAAQFLRPNHPDLAGLVMSPATLPISTYSIGGFEIEIETPWNGKATQMRVSVSQDRPTHFGRAIGATEVAINQVAFCEVGSALGSGADMPFGIFPGFSGGIVNFEQNQCTLNDQSSDSCSGLKIPRHDDPPGSKENNPTGNYIANMIAGINWDLDPAVNQLCEVGNSEFEPCNRVATTSGSDPNKIYDGLIRGRDSLGFSGDDIGYLERHHTIYCHSGDCYDGHTLEQVANCADGSCTDPRETVTWEEQIANGTFVAPPRETLTAIEDCDCPRFARIPVVESFPTADCTVTDPLDPTQVNRCTARVLGFEWIYILRPFYNGASPPNIPGEFFDDFGGNMGENVDVIAAIGIDFASDIDVEPGCFSEFKEGAPKAVRLING
jgi:hypothetical protein